MGDYDRIDGFSGTQDAYINYLESELLRCRQQLSQQLVSKFYNPYALHGTTPEVPKRQRWKLELEKFLNDVPTSSDWMKRRKTMQLVSVEGNVLAIKMLLGSSSHHQSHRITGSLIDRVTAYALLIKDFQNDRCFHSRLIRFQDLIFTSLCLTMMKSGHSEATVNSLMKSTFSDSTEKNLKRLYSGALWANRSMMHLMENGWGLRSTEIFLLCGLSLAQYGRFGEAPRETLTLLTNQLTKPEFVNISEEVDGWIPFSIPCIIKILVGDALSLQQICEALEYVEINTQLTLLERYKSIFEYTDGSKDHDIYFAFGSGISLESTFNRNCTLQFVRPYNSPVFDVAQKGDIGGMLRLLQNGDASINDVDPYGLGLLYHAAYYCRRGSGVALAMEMFSMLVKMGANTNWIDEIGNTPLETMIDGVLVYTAIGGGSVESSFPSLCEIAILFNKATSELWRDYISVRNFTELHQVLLGIDKTPLKKYLTWSQEAGTISNLIDEMDARGRTALTWAVEYGWTDAVKTLLNFGANSSQLRPSRYGNTPLLHLAIASPPSQLSTNSFLEVITMLLQAGVDVNAKDHEGWTPLHIAASWNLYRVAEVLASSESLDWFALTSEGELAYELSPNGDFIKEFYVINE